MRKKYQVTKVIADNPIWLFFAIGMLIFVSTITLFAFIYSNWHLIKSSNPIANEIISFSDGFYFSVVTQTTLGYGDLVPTQDGRLFVIIQVITGIVEISIFTSLLLMRFFWPSNLIKISDCMVFVPETSEFKIRISNVSSFNLSNIKNELWLNKRNDEGFSNEPIKLIYENLPWISSMSIWKIKTHVLPQEKIEDIFINLNKFYFQVSGSFINSTYIQNKTFAKNNIYCGEFLKVKNNNHKLAEYKKFKWEYFDHVSGPNNEKCRSCIHYAYCCCNNKQPS